MEVFNSRSIIERMKSVLKKENDKSMIEELGVAQTTFSNWKSRNNLPIEVILQFAQKHELSLDWLLTGKEANASRDTAESMLLAGFKELTDKQKMQAVTFVGNLANGITASTPSQSIGGNGVNVAGGIRIEK